MYQAPIKIIEQVQHDLLQQREDGIYRAVAKVGIDVDKEELIRALQYDRGQYEQGFQDGVASAKQWIPVAERRPDILGTCLVVVCRRYSHEKHYEYDVDVASYDPYGGTPNIDGCWDTFNDWDEGQQEIHVSHWMPLPEPPTEVADNG